MLPLLQDEQTDEDEHSWQKGITLQERQVAPDR